MRRFLYLFVMLSLALAACEGPRNNTSWSTAEKGAEIQPSLKKPVRHDAAVADSAAADSAGVDLDSSHDH